MWFLRTFRRFLLSQTIPCSLALVVLGAGVLGLGGCGSGQKLGRVHGKVTFQGKPVSEGIISFSNREKGVFLTAKLSADGSYELVTAQGRGLPLGTYQAAINPPLVDAPLGPALGPPKVPAYPNIPEKYRKPETSGLTLTVKEGDNPFDVDMTP